MSLPVNPPNARARNNRNSIQGNREAPVQIDLAELNIENEAEPIAFNQRNQNQQNQEPHSPPRVRQEAPGVQNVGQGITVHRSPQSPASPSANYNWQSLHVTVKERICFLFNNETLSDVCFILGKGTGEVQRIPAHKFVLSIGSVVFNAMFNGGFATDSCCHEVEIPDIEPASFLSLLKFLYTDEVLIGPDTVMSTLYAAKKYTVPTLEQKCVDFLKRNLGPDNAFTLLSQARLFDEPQLTDLCLGCIDKSTVDSFDAEGYTDIDLETLKSVLQRDSLSARESQLFQAAVRWADHECRRKDVANTSTNKRFVVLNLFFILNCFLIYIDTIQYAIASFEKSSTEHYILKNVLTTCPFDYWSKFFDHQFFLGKIFIIYKNPVKLFKNNFQNFKNTFNYQSSCILYFLQISLERCTLSYKISPDDFGGIC